MGILKRLTTFFKIRLTGALNKAEDPGQTLDYSYEKQLELLQTVRRSLVDVVTQEKRLNLQSNQLEGRYQKLDSQAIQALEGGREDLARQALEQQETLRGQITALQNQVEHFKGERFKLVESEKRLTERLEAFRTQKEMVKAQYSAAQAQVKIGEAVAGISDEMAEVNRAMQRAQDKVLGMQARANAIEELAEGGQLPKQLGPGETDLDQQLRQMSATQNIENRLAALKQQTQLEKQQPPQLDSPSS